MPEAAITTYSIESQRMFERGVKAAKAKQRRVAAGFLTKAVQLDPRHEQAWLWLSGVLDEPKEIAFCLNAVLKLNPDNEQARKGLAWLRHKHAEAAQQPETASQRLQAIRVPEYGEVVPEPETPAEPQTWWQEWRTSERNQRKMRIVAMIAMIVLVGVTSLFWWLTPQQSTDQAVMNPANSANAQSAPEQKLVVAPEVNNAELLQYLSAVGEVRQQLSQASTAYRQVSDVSTVAAEQIAAAKTYRDVLTTSYQQFNQIIPPNTLKDLHAEYLKGLELEQSAFDDVLEYYTNYNIAIANRAALRLQEANGHYQQAISGFNTYQTKLSQPLNANGFGER